MNLSVSEELLKRIKAINWFNNCGDSLSIIKNFNVKHVKSWKEAKTYYSDKVWSSTTLEARNSLTEFLDKNYIIEYQKWDDYVDIGWKIIDEEILNKLEEIKEKNKLDIKFINTAKWVILNAIMEDVYREAKNRPTFFLKLLEIYESGNFPCGWIGKWPEGSLVVY